MLLVESLSPEGVVLLWLDWGFRVLMSCERASKFGVDFAACCLGVVSPRGEASPGVVGTGFPASLVLGRSCW